MRPDAGKAREQRFVKPVGGGPVGATIVPVSTAAQPDYSETLAALPSDALLRIMDRNIRSHKVYKGRGPLRNLVAAEHERLSAGRCHDELVRRGWS